MSLSSQTDLCPAGTRSKTRSCRAYSLRTRWRGTTACSGARWYALSGHLRQRGAMLLTACACERSVWLGTGRTAERVPVCLRVRTQDS